MKGFLVSYSHWLNFNPMKPKSVGYASTSTAKPNKHGKKTYIVYLVGSTWRRVLGVARTQRKNYWGCLLNT